MDSTGSFGGKVALITGTPSGIGAALARELATRDAAVVLSGQDKTRLRRAWVHARDRGQGRCAAALFDQVTAWSPMATGKSMVANGDGEKMQAAQ